MIGHQAARANSHQTSRQRVFHDSLKRRVVILVVENPHPSDAAVQDVKHHSSGSNAWSSWHVLNLPTRASPVKIKRT